MCTNKVNAFVWDKVKFSRITFMNINLSVGTFVLKINLLPTTINSYTIDIYTDDITVE